MKNVKSQLILCQPDSNKGCCVCCGLFNHVDIAKSNLERFLSSSKHRIINRIEVNDSKLNSKSILTEIRDSTTFICPYQGFIHKNAPGCLLHKSVNGFDARDMSFFGQDICDSFLCPAHNILNNRQKTILIEYINDWFYYSLAIALPLSFIWILERLENDYDLDLSNKGI